MWQSRLIIKFVVTALLCSAVPAFAEPNKKSVSNESAKETGRGAAKTKDADKKISTSATNLKNLLNGGGGTQEGPQPVYIKSGSLALNSKDRVFTYKGNVEILRGDVKITADTVIGTYDEKNQLQRVICEDNVVLTKGEVLRGTANRAVYSIPLATVEMTENPELKHKGNVLSADRITVYVNEDRSEADGNVRVKVLQAENSAGIGAAKERFLEGERNAKAGETEAD